MIDLAYFEEIPCAVTVCDREGTIVAMNGKSVATFANDGGEALIGTNVLDCHPEPSRTQLAGMLETGSSNTYTIEKNGVKKMIIQIPWHRNGEFAGLIELSVEIPEELPHFIRG